MQVLLLGPPGAGKGTQAKLLSKELGAPHISTGEIFRKEIADETKLGLLAKSFIDLGHFVPDNITIEIVRERLGKDDCNEGFILDGFPRTLEQAVALKEMLEEMNLPLQAAVNISIPEQVLIDRLSKRKTCKNCGSVYSESATSCAKCGGELYQRSDDAPAVVKERIHVYQKLTEPLIKYYEDEKLLITVNGNQGVEKVLQDVKKAINA